MGVHLLNNHGQDKFRSSVEKKLDTFSFRGIFKNIEYLLQHDINVHNCVKRSWVVWGLH